MDVATRLSEVIARTIRFDGPVRRALRDTEGLSPQRRRNIYRDVLRRSLVDFRTVAGDFFPDYLADSARSLAPACKGRFDLQIDVARDLELLTYRTDDFAVEVESPRLMWDCHCSAQFRRQVDRRAANADPSSTCPIHRHSNGARLTEIYRRGLILTTYDGTDVIWRRSPEVWPPTVDTFAMCKNLALDGVLEREYESVLDIGCGTGLLGLYVGNRNPHTRRIFLADWLTTPLFYAMTSWGMRINCENDKSMTALLGLDTDWQNLDGNPSLAGVCVSNPPYLPSFADFPEVGHNHAVAGTELLEHIIEHSTAIAHDTYISFSDVALPEAEEAARRSGKVLRGVGSSHVVPFTVPEAFMREGYVERLATERGIIARDNEYGWWHRVQTYAVEEAG